MSEPMSEPMPKRGLGRPTEYRPEMCEVVIECGEQGLFFVEIARKLGVSKQCLYEWRQKHPDFGYALMRARELSEAHHAEVYRIGCRGPAGSFNAEAYRKMMAIVFEDWRAPAAQVEISGRDGKAIETKASIVDVSKLTDAQLEALDRAAGLLADPV